MRIVLAVIAAFAIHATALAQQLTNPQIPIFYPAPPPPTLCPMSVDNGCSNANVNSIFSNGNAFNPAAVVAPGSGNFGYVIMSGQATTLTGGHPATIPQNLPGIDPGYPVGYDKTLNLIDPANTGNGPGWYRAASQTLTLTGAVTSEGGSATFIQPGMIVDLAKSGARVEGTIAYMQGDTGAHCNTGSGAFNCTGTPNGSSGSYAIVNASTPGNVASNVATSGSPGTAYFGIPFACFWEHSLTGGAVGVSATGYLYFALNPAPSYLVIDGVPWSLVSSGASGNQTNIQGSLGATLTQLASDLNSHFGAALTVTTDGATYLLVTAPTGTAGNNIGLTPGNMNIAQAQTVIAQHILGPEVFCNGSDNASGFAHTEIDFGFASKSMTNADLAAAGLQPTSQPYGVDFGYDMSADTGHDGTFLDLFSFSNTGLHRVHNNKFKLNTALLTVAGTQYHGQYYGATPPHMINEIGTTVGFDGEYNSGDGQFYASATPGTASIVFSANPNNNDTFNLAPVLGATTFSTNWKFVTSGATTGQTNIKGTLALTLAQLVTDLQTTTLGTAQASPNNFAVFSASGGNTLNITYAAAGSPGTASIFALSASGITAGASVSGTVPCAGVGGQCLGGAYALNAAGFNDGASGMLLWEYNNEVNFGGRYNDASINVGPEYNSYNYYQDCSVYGTAHCEEIDHGAGLDVPILNPMDSNGWSVRHNGNVNIQTSYYVPGIDITGPVFLAYGFFNQLQGGFQSTYNFVITNWLYNAGKINAPGGPFVCGGSPSACSTGALLYNTGFGINTLGVIDIEHNRADPSSGGCFFNENVTTSHPGVSSFTITNAGTGYTGGTAAPTTNGTWNPNTGNLSLTFSSAPGQIAGSGVVLSGYTGSYATMNGTFSVSSTSGGGTTLVVFIGLGAAPTGTPTGTPLLALGPNVAVGAGGSPSGLKVAVAATVSGGSITALTMSQGTNVPAYLGSAPTLTIDPPVSGTTATATANLASWSVSGNTLTVTGLNNASGVMLPLNQNNYLVNSDASWVPQQIGAYGNGGATCTSTVVTNCTFNLIGTTASKAANNNWTVYNGYGSLVVSDNISIKYAAGACPGSSSPTCNLMTTGFQPSVPNSWTWQASPFPGTCPGYASLASISTRDIQRLMHLNDNEFDLAA